MIEVIRLGSEAESLRIDQPQVFNAGQAAPLCWMCAT
jgi:hypothetical protein